MRSRATFGSMLLLLALIAVVLPPLSAHANPGDTKVVDVAYNGTESDGDSLFPAFSTDGNLIAYRSDSRTLIGPPAPGSSNRQNLYVYNRATGITERITNTYNGTEFIGEVSGPGISGNGRIIAYVTNAQSVTPDDQDQGPSLFVYDRQSQTTQYITGVGSFNANEPTSISENGRYILYVSYYFSPGRAFIYDRDTGMSTQVASDVANPQMSRDGNWVVFRSQSPYGDDTNGQPDVFLYDVQSSEITIVSKPLNTTDQSDGYSDNPAINADGSVIAFWSQATNLVGAADSNNVPDIFVYDRTNNTMERANVGPGGVQGDIGSYYTPSLDSSGDRVSFTSCDTTLLVNPADGNGFCDVYIRDRSSGETRIASVSSSGEIENNESFRSAMNPDGSVVAFSSSILALIVTVTGVDASAFARGYGPRAPVRAVAALLVLVAVVFATLWSVFSISYAVTGRLSLGAATLEGMQTVFAIDLSLMVPGMALAGVLLRRRRPWGFVMGAAMSVFGAICQLNLAAAGWFQANAGVEGVMRIDPVGAVFIVVFLAAAAVMIRALRSVESGSP